jgi:hypothetical protein
MRFWGVVLAAMFVWSALTVVWWMDSVRNLNALSLAALILAAGGFQATLAMRKADADDPL